MAKASRLVARQAQALEGQADLLAEVLAGQERIEQKLHLLLEVLEKVMAAEVKPLSPALARKKEAAK